MKHYNAITILSRFPCRGGRSSKHLIIVAVHVLNFFYLFWQTCTDLVNSYKCDCVEGWAGTICEVDRDECVDQPDGSSPCLHNGICQDEFNGFSCFCQQGFKSVHEDFRMCILKYSCICREGSYWPEQLNCFQAKIEIWCVVNAESSTDLT